MLKNRLMQPSYFEEIQTQLEPLRNQLLHHPIYQQIDTLDGLRLFMSHHVFAVWDFMSLLKALQRRICCLDVPWLPPRDSQAARFVNEIVLGEECDDDGEGGYASHFDLYHQAMQLSGASTVTIDRFILRLREGGSVEDALAIAETPESVRNFVQHTFQIIQSDDPCAIASAFTFGREDLLPDVFRQVISELNLAANGGLNRFKYYLNRHIELDGDHHGPMATRLMTSLCGHDEQKWRIAAEAAVSSLEARKRLWDGMLSAIQQQQGSLVRPE